LSVEGPCPIDPAPTPLTPARVTLTPEVPPLVTTPNHCQYGKAWLLGVAIAIGNGTKFSNAGEGIKDLTVRVTTVAVNPAATPMLVVAAIDTDSMASHGECGSIRGHH
jgi:hypothetical protein